MSKKSKRPFDDMDMCWEYQHEKFADAETIYRLHFIAQLGSRECLTTEYYIDPDKLQRKIEYILDKESEGYKLLSVGEFKRVYLNPLGTNS